jgi:hypothetical protein
MQQIEEWLAKIGLERYAPAFIDNDIDASVLRYLTDADLEKIGVSLGHRRKLLAAIAELGSAATRTWRAYNDPGGCRATSAFRISRGSRRTPLRHRHVL